jgi:superfamily II DNA or RNA helicase
MIGVDALIISGFIFNMKPYPDQEKSIQEIFKEFETKQRILFQLSTGGGKTAIFSFIAKRFIKQSKQNVLVLAHREELINQTLQTLRTIGVTCESVVASKKRLQHHSDCYVSMIQTIKNRLRLYPDFVKDIGLIIVDEAHLDMHKEIFDYFQEAKILAVTATPISLKKISFSRCSICKKDHKEVVQCCGFETYEYTRNFTYSEIYENIILGDSISQLIDKDRLVRDINYEIGNIDRNSFSIDSKTGDFDTKSTGKYFGQFNVVKNYEEICKGEKTIIFNSSTTTNKNTYDFFSDAGYYNVRMLDSINTKQSERKPILDWFKNTPDAILLNCGVLTAGFDEPTIQAVILNRATLSLSLFLQMIGRGGRKCESIYKPHFKVIDGGGNIQYFASKYGGSGKWSDEIDWESIFFGSNEKPRPKKEAMDSTKLCENCDCLVAKNSLECEECGFIFKEKKKNETISEEVAQLVDEIPLPNGKKIVSYCEKVRKDKNFAWLILQNQILDLFVRHEITFGNFTNTLDNGKFEESIRRIIKEPYQSIQSSFLESGTMRTKAWVIKKIKTKLEKYYEKRK